MTIHIHSLISVLFARMSDTRKIIRGRPLLTWSYHRQILDPLFDFAQAADHMADKMFSFTADYLMDIASDFEMDQQVAV